MPGRACRSCTGEASCRTISASCSRFRTWMEPWSVVLAWILCCLLRFSASGVSPRSVSMYIALVIVHIIVAFVMVGVILLQSGKGAEIGAAFGGSSQTVFGSRGAGTFLGKLTAVTATIFMLTSLSLAIMSKQ